MYNNNGQAVLPKSAIAPHGVMELEVSWMYDIVGDALSVIEGVLGKCIHEYRIRWKEEEDVVILECRVPTTWKEIEKLYNAWNTEYSKEAIYDTEPVIIIRVKGKRTSNGRVAQCSSEYKLEFESIE